MLDKKLLMEIFSIQATLSDDKDINAFIEDVVSKIDGVSVEKDAFGNIYATKGTGENGYKCTVCHTDTVHGMKENRKVFEHDGFLFAMASRPASTYAEKSVQMVGTGGDDKCGIYVCIQSLKDFNNIKAAFFRFEESGCNGSGNANMDFFSDCNFVVQCDRKNSSDFIMHTNGISVASKAFEDTMAPLYTKRGYSKAFGTSTDVGVLKKNGLAVSAINMSSGYINPHSDLETVNLNSLENCYGLVSDMFNEHGDTRFEHKHTKTTFENWNRAASAAKGFFSNTLDKNILQMNLGFDPTEIESESMTKFVEIGSTKMYRLIFDDIIYLEHKTCPLCSSLGTVGMSTYDGELYCVGSSCPNVDMDQKLMKDVFIEDAGMKMVYDRLNDVWIQALNAVWSEKLDTYILKI